MFKEGIGEYMKKIKLLLSALVFILIIDLCMGYENVITDTNIGKSKVSINSKYKLNVKNDSTQLGRFVFIKSILSNHAQTRFIR